MWCDALPLTFQNKDAHTKTISLSLFSPSLPPSFPPFRIKMLAQRQPPSLFLSLSSLHLLSPYTYPQWHTFIFTLTIHSLTSTPVSPSIMSPPPPPPPPPPQVLIQPGASFTRNNITRQWVLNETGHYDNEQVYSIISFIAKLFTVDVMHTGQTQIAQTIT